jgi:hypothetical protein
VETTAAEAALAVPFIIDWKVAAPIALRREGKVACLLDLSKVGWADRENCVIRLFLALVAGRVDEPSLDFEAVRAAMEEEEVEVEELVACEEDKDAGGNAENGCIDATAAAAAALVVIVDAGEAPGDAYMMLAATLGSNRLNAEEE